MNCYDGFSFFHIHQAGTSGGQLAVHPAAVEAAAAAAAAAAASGHVVGLPSSSTSGLPGGHPDHINPVVAAAGLKEIEADLARLGAADGAPGPSQVEIKQCVLLPFFKIDRFK